MEPLKPQASSLPAADITAQPSTPESIVHYAFPVRQADEDQLEFLLQVRASTLARARKRIQKLTKRAFPWAELCLAVAMASVGAALGAIPAHLTIDTLVGIFFYVVLPVLSASSLVAYAFLRHFAAADVSAIATEVLEELPDPERQRQQAHES